MTLLEDVKTLKTATGIAERLELIGSLLYNWDGQNAVPITQNVIQNTNDFLNILGKLPMETLYVENIMPTPYGTIELDWRKGDTLLSIEIGSTQIGFFTQFPDNNNPSSNGFNFNGINIPNELNQAFDKFFQA